MNVAPDQTIISGLQILLDHRSMSSIGQKILMILHQNSVNIVNDVKTVFVVIPPSLKVFFILSLEMYYYLKRKDSGTTKKNMLNKY